jgi:hypothetical protein
LSTWVLLVETARYGRGQFRSMSGVQRLGGVIGPSGPIGGVGCNVTLAGGRWGGGELGGGVDAAGRCGAGRRG